PLHLFDNLGIEIAKRLVRVHVAQRQPDTVLVTSSGSDRKIEKAKHEEGNVEFEFARGRIEFGRVGTCGVTSATAAVSTLAATVAAAPAGIATPFKFSA